jgi:hypothetical protein
MQVDIDVGHLYTIILPCASCLIMFVAVFADLAVRTHDIYFSSSQMFHNSCELLNVYLDLGPDFFYFCNVFVRCLCRFHPSINPFTIPFPFLPRSASVIIVFPHSATGIYATLYRIT